MSHKFTLVADAPQYTYIQYNSKNSKEYDLDFTNLNDVWFTINHDQTILVNPIQTN